MQERIALKAQDLFLKYGIRSISMDEIASQLGISKKTIYQYYADKDDLVMTVIDAMLADNEGECFNTHKLSENPVHEIFVALNMMQDLLKVMNPTIVYDLQKYHPAAYKKLSDHQNKFLYRLIVENLEEGKKQQLYRPEMDIDMIARFRLVSVFMMFNPDFTSSLRKHTLVAIMEEITIHFLYGITTSKGQKLIQKYLNR
ncbi:MAG: TetR/AcrR family transcriptional regulator [Chitinophagaceae bacterium]|nr:TetR/AcrR family transcriptional regulator [Chitinophagaceae bacterium]MCW5928562.1 TetR/AcrR family transcriptional regulator [Chitinophagaceae bacterium]